MTLTDRLNGLRAETKKFTEVWLKRHYPDVHSEVIDRTLYLSDVKFNERLYHIEHNLTSSPICPTCKVNPCEWFYDYARYKQCCSHECFLKCPDRFLKIQKTILKEYGSKSAFGNENIREKSKATIKSRYGVDNVMHDTNIRARYTATMIENTGYSSNFSDPTTRQKIEETFMSNYGTTNPLASGWKRDEITKSIISKYGVDNVNKALLTPESRNLLGDEKWLRIQLETNEYPLYEVAKFLDCDPTTVSNWANKFGIDISKQKSSFLERKLYGAIKEQYTGTILQHDRNIIKPLELDLVFPEKQLAIEVCGNYWHSDKFKENNYHQNKYRLCSDSGYQLLTIYEDEINDKFDIVINSILSKLGVLSTPSIYARNTCIKEISKDDKKAFLNQYHIQGNDKSSTAYGLFNDTELVAVISLQLTATETLISRYATSGKVVGGFTKLLKFVRSKYNKLPITTFADMRWSTGELYKNSGFVQDSIIPISYYYIHKMKRFHKFNFRKTFITKHFNVDETHTERQMMNSLHIHRLYDCGKIKFILNSD